MSIRSIRGVETWLEDRGRGAPVLLVHGFLVSGREWEELALRLAGRHRVIVPDLPGFGRTAKPADFPYGRPGYCDHLLALLDDLEIERASVVGHSMGGGIASELAARSPDRVDRLVLVDAACHPMDVSWRARLPLLPLVGPLVWRHLYTRAMFRDYFRKEVWNGRGPPTWDRVDAFYDDFAPPEARAAAYKVLPHVLDLAGLVPLLPRIDAPTLVVWGEHDRLVPLRLGERLARQIPGARLEVLAGAGHAVNEERPEELARLLLEFLA
ncbi:MAG: alpha/beta hydrolase [Deltaproteobacteria bacterium]|nr:alpha/beta hydrolase [Deltaproteobacteria bacterium]